MSRVCELTGKSGLTGNNVSHSNNRTKRRYLPNLQPISFLSDTLGESVQFRVTVYGARCVEHAGGLDTWLKKTKDEKLSIKARRLKRTIAKKMEEAA
jgi:large subunit ribosomal protein L28